MECAVLVPREQHKQVSIHVQSLNKNFNNLVICFLLLCSPFKSSFSRGYTTSIRQISPWERIRKDPRRTLSKAAFRRLHYCYNEKRFSSSTDTMIESIFSLSLALLTNANVPTLVNPYTRGERGNKRDEKLRLDHNGNVVVTEKPIGPHSSGKRLA